jgi:beta-lactamase regulating signal transducer with metallopeptidase domain
VNTLTTHLALWFLSTTLHVCILAGLILLAEHLFRRVLPAAWRHGLWCLVVVRLVCPVVPATPLSPLNLLGHAATRDASWLRSGQTAAASVAPKATAARPGPSARALPAAGGAVVGPRADWGTSLPAVFVGLWFMGCLGLLAKGLRDALAFRARLRQGRAIRDPAMVQALDACRSTMGVRREVRLLETTAVSAPALTGILRPTLLVPLGLLDRLSAAEREWVFLHELAHLRRWDLPVDALLSLLQALHWPNPAVHLAAGRLRAARELACDAQVLARRASGEANAGSYGQTLLKLVARVAANPSVPALAATVESSRRLETRLRAIGAYRPSRRRQHLVGAAALLLVAAFGLSRAVDAPATGSAQPAAAAPATPATPEMPPDGATAFEEQFARHPLVCVSVRFIDVRGTPTEVREALPALGIDAREAGDSATPPPLLLGPAECDRLLADLRARRADILDSPKVTTLSGTTAIMRVVTERYFPESWKVVQREGRLAVEPTFKDATEVGSILEVLPRLDAKRPGEASLELTARVTEVGEPPYRQETLTHTDDDGRRYEFPVYYANLNVRTASASVVLRAGHSVRLYGGTLAGQRKIVDKVPVLGSVPLLGRLFRSTRHEETASALLVLVTLERAGNAASLEPAAP